MKLLIVALLLSPFTLLADMPSMKRDNFESVYVGSDVQDCPITDAEVAEVWDSELLRARLKDVGGYANEGFLWLFLACMKDPNSQENYVYYVRSEWSWRDVSGRYPVLTLSSSIGTGNKKSIEDAASEVIASAITQYLEANLK